MITNQISNEFSRSHLQDSQVKKSVLFFFVKFPKLNHRSLPIFDSFHFIPKGAYVSTSYLVPSISELWKLKLPFTMLPHLPALPITLSTNFRWDRCSPAPWLKIVSSMSGMANVLRLLNSPLGHSVKETYESRTEGQPPLHQHRVPQTCANVSRWDGFDELKIGLWAPQFTARVPHQFLQNPTALQFRNEDPGDTGLKTSPQTLAWAPLPNLADTM